MISKRTTIINIFAFTDAKVVLKWIQSSPHRWNAYIGNRITDIQSNTFPAMWRRVSGKENPADCLSRGLLPEQLINHQLWWTGPSWMDEPEDLWPCYLLF